ncbi:hypothetical protein B0G76_7685 [Paraburkholderia sp. BL23I1N1]|nr:hypothetical protein B0G76_7685 [Paraburkholderia sp. BL23I1N1]
MGQVSQRIILAISREYRENCFQNSSGSEDRVAASETVFPMAYHTALCSISSAPSQIRLNEKVVNSPAFQRAF